jgi:hypothetical protein
VVFVTATYLAASVASDQFPDFSGFFASKQATFKRLRQRTQSYALADAFV